MNPELHELALHWRRLARIMRDRAELQDQDEPRGRCIGEAETLLRCAKELRKLLKEHAE